MATASRPRLEVTAGEFYPLGATLHPEGVNFALYSERATAVSLLLFDEPRGEPVEEIPLARRTRLVWHAFVRGLKAGQLYAYRVDGPFKPLEGLRFNPKKLVLDPYAKALTHKAANEDGLLLAYDPTSVDRDLSSDSRDNGRLLPKCIVVDDRFDWRGDRPLEIPFDDLLLYEVHLKGFTAHPSSGSRSPGTYLGFIDRIPHLKALGVNAVELLPVHEFYVEDFLRAKGLTNYWGYNTVSFFAPESTYSSGKAPGCQVPEFKTLVRELHKAGIAVILDVVYNHTGEGSELGPTLHFRGIDNPTYYHLTGPAGEAKRRYENYTGCGNSVDANHPAVIRLIMDSLRYWVQEMHVDGFRFDLASVLGREEGSYRKSASFFDAIAQDPVLNRVLLIAEPWDLGTYEVGNFPVDWSEWNARYRDTARRFVKGDGGMLGDLGWRLTGSADLFGEDGRHPYHSINFVTCHDGFTLWDLVSYDRKRNEANGEDNRDGSNDNHSWNCGVEGETGELKVLELRARMAKNHLCLLLLSHGTPMLLGGDEFLRTQKGNNNAYCQDNALSWFDWSLAEKNAGFLEFTRKLIQLRRRYAALRRRHFVGGKDADLDSIADVSWYGPDGRHPKWQDPEARTLAVLLDADEGGADDHQLLLLLNADHRELAVTLPKCPTGRWHRLLDTALPAGKDLVDEAAAEPVPADRYPCASRSVALLVAR